MNSHYVSGIDVDWIPVRLLRRIFCFYITGSCSVCKKCLYISLKVIVNFCGLSEIVTFCYTMYSKTLNVPITCALHLAIFASVSKSQNLRSQISNFKYIWWKNRTSLKNGCWCIKVTKIKGPKVTVNIWSPIFKEAKLKGFAVSRLTVRRCRQLTSTAYCVYIIDLTQLLQYYCTLPCTVMVVLWC